MTILKTPTIVCLCGSGRFPEVFREANRNETLKGRIVLSIGVNKNTERFAPAVVAELDELHLRKIDLADEILVLNVGGYIGKSTRREVCYAREQEKKVRWWDTQRVPEEFQFKRR